MRRDGHTNSLTLGSKRLGDRRAVLAVEGGPPVRDRCGFPDRASFRGVFWSAVAPTYRRPRPTPSRNRPESWAIVNSGHWHVRYHRSRPSAPGEARAVVCSVTALQDDHLRGSTPLRVGLAALRSTPGEFSLTMATAVPVKCDDVGGVASRCIRANRSRGCSPAG